MPKRSRTQRREEEEGQASHAGSEARSKSKHDRARVNSRIQTLIHSEECLRMYNEKLHDREILATKYVNFREVTRMYEDYNVDTANVLVNHGWVEFVTIDRPVCQYLLRILMSNLDQHTMISWIGKRKVDLSEAAWCRIFSIPVVTGEEEESIMRIEKEEIFFRLTGIHNLGIHHFIKINQLHQDATTRLSAQIVMNILVPKKGSKEQIKLEEGRILYALVADKKINLAKLIVGRLRAALVRKTSPITYGMHLMAIMEKAGVNLRITEEQEKIISAPIDHHTLKRMGYRIQHGGWDYVGKGRVNASFPVEGQGERQDEEEEGQEAGTQEATHDHTQAESTAPSRPAPRPTQSNLHITSQIQSLKTDISHLQSFLVEQLHLMQATLLSKLDALDSRVQNLEDHLILQPHPSPPQYSPFHPTDPTNPKGKRPLHSPPPSPPPEPSTHAPSPPPEPSAQAPSVPQSPSHESSPTLLPFRFTYPLGSPIVTFPQSPIPIDSTLSNSPSSSTSSSTAADRYAIVVRAPSIRHRSPSVYSEATTSDHHSPPPPPPTQPPPSPPTQPSPTATYRR